MPERRLTREQDLKTAFQRAKLSPNVHTVVFHLLYNRASWVTGVIDDKRQPRSVAALARSVDMPIRTLERTLKIAEDLGWVERTLHPGRGRTTTYQVTIGVSMMPSPREPMTDAERQRRYRERQKVRHENVTEVRQKIVTQDEEKPATSASRVTPDWRNGHGAERDDFAGQSVFVLKDIRDGGSSRGGGLSEAPWGGCNESGWPPGTEGEWQNRDRLGARRRAEIEAEMRDRDV